MLAMMSTPLQAYMFLLLAARELSCYPGGRTGSDHECARLVRFEVWVSLADLATVAF